MIHPRRNELLKRYERVCRLAREDTAKHKPNPLGPGFLTRSDRYLELQWRIQEQLKAFYIN